MAREYRMTGEMSWIKPDGEDSNGEVWAIHAAVARAIGGELRPFDAYQGPYIALGADVCAGVPPYRVPVRGVGSARLWLTTDDGVVGTIWREDAEESSAEFWREDEAGAIEAARSLIEARP